MMTKHHMSAVVLTSALLWTLCYQVGVEGKPYHTNSAVHTYPPTKPYGCSYDGGHYYPGQVIYEGKSGNWCYGAHCTRLGEVLHWDLFHCGTEEPTTTPQPETTEDPWKESHRTTPYPTTEAQTTEQQTTEQQTTEYPTTEEQTTEEPTTEVHSTVPRRPGCFENGKHYDVGEEISRGDDGRGWCYGSICQDDNQIAIWDNFNCGPKTPEDPWKESHRTTPYPTTEAQTTEQQTTEQQTTEYPTTEEQTTEEPTTEVHSTVPRRPGCFENGKHYDVGEEISRGDDGRGWCYSSICQDDNQIVIWDDFRCGPKTTEDPWQESHRTTPYPTTEAQTTVPL